MNIQAINIERSDRNIYCGTLNYTGEDKLEGNLLWTFEIIGPSKIVVGFVQGDTPDWLEIAQKYANYLSDNIILKITKYKNTIPLHQHIN